MNEPKTPAKKKAPVKKAPAKKSTQGALLTDHWGGNAGSHCSHKDGTLVFTAERPDGTGISFYAGTYRGAGDQDLILDLADHFITGVSGFNLPGPLEAFAQSYSKPVMKIRWPDGGVPGFRADHWERLIDALLSSPTKSVYACCMGGHGRTGTCLTIIMALMQKRNLAGVPQGVHPTEHLRSVYCSEVVETKAQTEYIEKITGLPTAKLITPAYEKRYTSTKSHIYDHWDRDPFFKPPDTPKLPAKSKTKTLLPELGTVLGYAPESFVATSSTYGAGGFTADHQMAMMRLMHTPTMIRLHTDEVLTLIGETEMVGTYSHVCDFVDDRIEVSPDPSLFNAVMSGVGGPDPKIIVWDGSGFDMYSQKTKPKAPAHVN